MLTEMDEELGVGKTPGAHVRQLRREIQSLLSKVSEDESALPSAFASTHQELQKPSSVVHRSLSEALRLEEKAHSQCRAEMEAKDLEWREALADAEVKMESLRLDLATAKAHARKLARASTHAEAFADYEKLVADLRRTCADLRARNVDLEKQRGSSNKKSVYTTTKEAKVVRRLETAVSDLEAENSSLRKALRGLPLAERVAKQQTRIAQAREKDLARLALDLEKERRRRDDDHVHIEELRTCLLW